MLIHYFFGGSGGEFTLIYTLLLGNLYINNVILFI